MKLLIIILPLLCALIAPKCFAVEAKTDPVSKPRPNILTIILDDENGFAGRTDLAPQPVTPNLDRLGKRGVTFANAQCAAPVCNPSRSAFMSGLRPSTTGIYTDAQGVTPPDHILTRTTALPTYFQEHGYLTAGSGKIFEARLAGCSSIVSGTKRWNQSARAAWKTRSLRRQGFHSAA